MNLGTTLPVVSLTLELASHTFESMVSFAEAYIAAHGYCSAKDN